MRILIVEDEKEITDGIKAILEKEGYSTEVAYDGKKGLECIEKNIYDLVLLDIMLPYMSGLEILKEIREEEIQTPVILLTAKSQTDDKITGLDAGADDYMTKPFDAGELLARVRARVRNNADVKKNIISAYDINLDISTYKLTCGDKSVKLSKTEYQLLEYLMLNKGQVLSKDMILDKVWGYESDSEYNNLEVYITFLRKKFAFLNTATSIANKKGVGYSLVSGEK